MLSIAIRQRDRRGAIGQISRLAVAGPGSLAGRYPTGNSRVTMALTETAEVSDDLAAICGDTPTTTSRDRTTSPSRRP